jgi:long-chain acyl-CoA synthetase
MGCTPTRQIIYNNLDNTVLKTNEDKYSGPYVRTDIKSYKEQELFYQDKTLIEEIIRSCDSNYNRDCLGYRKLINGTEYEKNYTFFKYGEIKGFAQNLAINFSINKLASRDNTISASDYEFIGIFSKNCVEWVVTDIACQLMSITTATFYSTLGEVAFEHICNQTKVSTICIAPDSANTLIKYKNKYGLLNVQNVVVFNITLKMDESILKELENAGLKVYLLSELIQPQNNLVFDFKFSNPNTTLTLCYTSGTTNLPKGAELTQRNFISELVNIEDTGYLVNNNSVHFSYLPLAHVMERVSIFLFLIKGGKSGFITGDVKTYLKEDISLIRPTVLIAVPRVLSTLRQVILDEFARIPAGCKKNMAEKALRVKRENLQNGEGITHKLYDSLVFSKVREKFGGRIEVIITGSAPLTKEIADDIKIMFSAPIMEAYGLTECSGACVATFYSDFTNECAGGCVRTAKIKLLDVPEMKYGRHTTLNGEHSPTGEICIYGPIVFKGYFLNEEETKKAIDSEGWFHTGDVGRIMPNNQGLKIIDRVKEIFKLSQGEYIAPSKLESVYMKCQYVSQICVYGDSTKNNIVAIIIPNQNNLRELIKSQGKWLENSKLEDFFDDKEVRDAVVKELDSLAKSSLLNSLEKIISFVFSNKEFTVDNGCLTPTMKLVRRKIADEFKAEIEKLYS